MQNCSLFQNFVALCLKTFSKFRGFMPEKYSFFGNSCHPLKKCPFFTKMGASNEFGLEGMGVAGWRCFQLLYDYLLYMSLATKDRVQEDLICLPVQINCIIWIKDGVSVYHSISGSLGEIPVANIVINSDFIPDNATLSPQVFAL